MSETALASNGRGVTWRPLGSNEVLAKCSAQGLELGGCFLPHAHDSAYCYYHDKVQKGEVDTFLSLNSAGSWTEVPPHSVYPVWPLPVHGYVWLVEATVAA